MIDMRDEADIVICKKCGSTPPLLDSITEKTKWVCQCGEMQVTFMPSYEGPVGLWNLGAGVHVGQKHIVSGGFVDMALEDVIAKVEAAGLFWAIEGGPDKQYVGVVQATNNYTGDALAYQDARSAPSPAEALQMAFDQFAK